MEAQAPQAMDSCTSELSSKSGRVSRRIETVERREGRFKVCSAGFQECFGAKFSCSLLVPMRSVVDFRQVTLGTYLYADGEANVPLQQEIGVRSICGNLCQAP